MTATRTLDPARVADRYAEALLDPASDPYAANAILEDAVAGGLSPDVVAVEIIPAALSRVGRAWEAGDVSVAHEHLATEAVRGWLRELAARLRRPRVNRGSIVVAAVEGELHDLGSRILADLLAADGWDVLYVGAATPTEALAALVRDRAPRAVAISATLPAHLPALREAVARLRAEDMPPTFLLVGGQACAAERDLADRVGADACELRADRALEVLAAAEPIRAAARSPRAKVGFSR